MIIMQKTKFVKQREKGFTLIEVLVALVLLGFGFISMLMLQYRSLQHSNAAYYQGISSQIVGGLAASIRANSEAGTGYGHSGAYSYTPGTAPTAPSPSCIDDSGTVCTPEQIAKTDIYWARQAAFAQLPGGDVFIVYNGVADSSYDVYILWQNQEKDSQTDASMQSTCAAIGIAVPTTTACLSTRVRI